MENKKGLKSIIIIFIVVLIAIVISLIFINKKILVQLKMKTIIKFHQIKMPFAFLIVMVNMQYLMQ